MIGSDFLLAILIFMMIFIIAIAVVYTGQNTVPILANIPNYNTPYTPAIAGATAWPSPLQATMSILGLDKNFDQFIFMMFIFVNFAAIAAVGLLNPPPSPMTIAILFILMCVVVFTSLLISNVVNMFANVPVLQNAVALFPQTRALFANLGEFEIVFSLLLIIVTSARSRGGGGATGGSKAILG